MLDHDAAPEQHTAFPDTTRFTTLQLHLSPLYRLLHAHEMRYEHETQISEAAPPCMPELGLEVL